MKRFLLVLSCFFSIYSTAFCQREGWSSSCPINSPQVTEVMIDAFGDNEFYSEYLILKTSGTPYNIENFSLKVINPTNNAFIGSVKIEKNNAPANVLDTLNSKIGSICASGTVFRDIFSEPYLGIVPPHSVVLIFNNKDSVDLSYLNNDAFKSLCGSKVFVALGTLKTQSPGVSIFRNHPRNGSCGTTGCLRQIQFQFEGINSPFCSEITYDIKNLPHLNTSNPPDGYGDGSYIRPQANGVLNYGGGNLTGQGVPMPPLSMMCSVPPPPDFGNHIWNVSVFEGFKNFTNFKGFYSAKGNHTPFIPATMGSFEYNMAHDGWNSLNSPSEAHTVYGALTTYEGCNVATDSISIMAQRQGFECSNYTLKLIEYDDFLKVRIDNNGDGSWDFDKTFDSPNCSTGCNTDIWKGYLNTSSKVEIWSSDIKNDFKSHILFFKDTTTGVSFITVNAGKDSTICEGDSAILRGISNIAGAQYEWKNLNGNLISNQPNIHITPSLSTLYVLKITNSEGCFNYDTVKIDVKKCPKCTQADSTFITLTTCNPLEIDTLKKVLKNKNGCDSIIFTITQLAPSDIKYQLSISKSISCNQDSNGIIALSNINGGKSPYHIKWNTGYTSLILKNIKAGFYKVSITDANGCLKTDSTELPNPPPLSMKANGVNPKCLHDANGLITVSNMSGGTPPYSLFLNDINQVFSIMPFALQGLKAGQYPLKLLDKNNCSFDTTLSLKEGRELILSLGSDVKIDLGDSLTLYAAHNHPFELLRWTSNDSLICTDCLPLQVHPFKTSQYKLWIKDELGCQAQDSMTVFINKKEHIFIPTSFSPNDDGVNDTFTIYAANEAKVIKTIKIFNRWGDLVFEADNILPNDESQGWNGYFNSKPAADETYIYYTEIEFVDGKKSIFQGNITLTR